MPFQEMSWQKDGELCWLKLRGRGMPVNTYIVAGGIFQKSDGDGLFTLVCPATGELPYVLEKGIKPYFKLIWQNAHLYEVEEDYTLTLVDVSTEALDCGVLAPERVTLDSELVEKLQISLKAFST